MEIKCNISKAREHELNTNCIIINQSACRMHKQVVMFGYCFLTVRFGYRYSLSILIGMVAVWLQFAN